MAKFILKRILVAIPVLLIISVLVFLLMQLAPYDAIDTMINPRMTPDQIEALRERYGYNDPLWVQYFAWLKQILSFDFGYSITTKDSVAAQLMARLPHTIMLVLPAYLTAYVLAIVLGIVAGSHHGSRADKIIRRHRLDRHLGADVLVLDAAHLCLWVLAGASAHRGHADGGRRQRP